MAETWSLYVCLSLEQLSWFPSKTRAAILDGVNEIIVAAQRYGVPLTTRAGVMSYQDDALEPYRQWWNTRTDFLGARGPVPREEACGE